MARADRGARTLPEPTLDEEPLQDRLDVVHPAEHALQLCSSTPPTYDDEITRSRVAEPLAVDRHRYAGREDRLADDELAPPGDLYDEKVRQTFRKRRSVSMDAAAPSSSPSATRIRPLRGNASACTP